MLLIEFIFANKQWSYINYCSSMLKKKLKISKEVKNVYKYLL